MLVVKFILLVVALNIIRYLAGGPLEMLFIAEGMHGVMPAYPEVFDVDFSTSDLLISFGYNFMLWLTATWVFFLSWPALKGHMIVRSLKIFGLMGLFFISLAAVYMNHFTVPVRPFFLYSMLDAVILFPLVGFANGLLFPWIFKTRIEQSVAEA